MTPTAHGDTYVVVSDIGEYIIDVSKSPSINEVSYFTFLSSLRKVHVYPYILQS